MRWGIISTGTIAKKLAEAVNQYDSSELVAVASRNRASAVQFATEFGIPTAHESYEALLQDPNVDVVYVATPHTSHLEWARAAVQHGKHTLVEKPIGLNHGEAMAAVHAAKQQNRFLMEAFMYRCHPQTQRVRELIQSGAIGEVRHLQAQFGYHAPFNADSRLFSSELGGGGILDVGCYPVSLARYLLGEPESVTGHGHVGQSGVDEWASATLHYPNGVSAIVATSVSVLLDNTATIYGSEGQIFIPQPWQPGEQWSFEVRNAQGVREESGTAPPIYVCEVNAVQTALADGRIDAPEMSHADTLGNARTLDAWRAEIGLTYPLELPSGHKAATAPSPQQHIAQTPVAGIAKPVSRLVMGCDNQPNMRHAAIMWDHFFSLGGNTFDTAHIYGGGKMESLLGAWHQANGVREQMVLIGKGAHTPHDAPEHIGPQLTESLDRLQTDYVDLYFLHRDNPNIPVDEFLSALTDEVSRGRIRAFGGSNWSLERTQALNEAADASGSPGFVAISNNFSLARMVNRIWPGTEATDDAFLNYLAERQMALFPWSSQARGFFTPWADAVIAEQGREHRTVTTMEPTIAELTRTWFSEENHERRRRAGELADAKGTSMINIALAYVLNQPFPTHPLVGPRTLDEIDSCVEALSCELSNDEVAWLDLRG